MMVTDELTPYLNALRSGEPADNLLRLVIDLKNNGGNQDEAYHLLSRLRETVGSDSTEASEEDSRTDDLICDVMDNVVGWCSPGAHIFSSTFDERIFWSRRR